MQKNETLFANETKSSSNTVGKITFSINCMELCYRYQTLTNLVSTKLFNKYVQAYGSLDDVGKVEYSRERG